MLLAQSRHRLHCSSLSLLRRLRPETSHPRCNSSFRAFQLDPLLAEVLNAPERTIPKSPYTNPIDPTKADLPSQDEWRKIFPHLLANANRVSIRNPQTASRLADVFIPQGSGGKIVIEAFPGKPSSGTVSFACKISQYFGDPNRSRPTYSGVAQLTKNKNTETDSPGRI